MLVLCADEMTPPGGKLGKSKDGAELMMAVNYLANFHLMSILSPALRAQPPDRDVRIIMGICASYLGGELGELASASAEAENEANGKQSKKGKKHTKESPKTLSLDSFTPTTIYGTTKLALLPFCSAFQKHLSSIVRKDGFPTNARVLCVDPGWTRTPGMRRYLTRGSLWGLLLYLIMYPFWWLVLKSPTQGAQSFLWAVMDGQLSSLGNSQDGLYIKECRVIPIQRQEVHDENVQKRLWESSDATIMALETESAIVRSREKKSAEQATNSTGVDKPQAEKQPGFRWSKKAIAAT
jgi:NAD(P)-dependent dehydrogenase (short-subunit alcohol dehydrogenase family)